jgi:hypothetical protein
VLPGNLFPTVQDTFHSVETCSCMWMCVSQAEGPSLPSTSLHPPCLRASTQFLFTQQVGIRLQVEKLKGMYKP